MGYLDRAFCPVIQDKEYKKCKDCFRFLIKSKYEAACKRVGTDIPICFYEEIMCEEGKNKISKTNIRNFKKD